MEIAISLILSLSKFFVSIILIKSIDLSSKNGLTNYFILAGIKNILLLGLALAIPLSFGFDKKTFFLSFAISYFLLLGIEVLMIRKILNKKDIENQGKTE